MRRENQILGLAKVGQFLKTYLQKNSDTFENYDVELEAISRKSQIENPWFTPESLKYALNEWAELLIEEKLTKWVSKYKVSEKSLKIGLILAGNLPMVGLHDVIATILSGHEALVKVSSKDRHLIPFILKLWKENTSANDVPYQLLEKLVDFDAVIATGSNNTARYLNYYFEKYPNIIRKNRTSVAVLTGNETDDELKALANDIFIYFGLGCRNVTRLFIPEGVKLDRLFENFVEHKNVINHNKYANNYDYNRAIYLLNKEQFWDNNFVLIREHDDLFSPLAVLNFSRYNDLSQVNSFIKEHGEEIQAIVSSVPLEVETLALGDAQKPDLETYADNVDTMEFLTSL